MISNNNLKRLFLNAQNFLSSQLWDRNKMLNTQFFRGINGSNWEGQHPGSCTRHKIAFDKYNIIPRYCFDCYKVSIELDTVV